jgi:putative ABC transport system ATP-binding protein
VIKLFHELHMAGSTIVLVTHSQEIADNCPRCISIRDGKILSDIRNS